MPRNMSFALTLDQIQARTKTVTRRTGWTFLQPGDTLNAAGKTMGLRKGEKVTIYCQIRVVSVGREPLSAITQEDVILEGFPELTPEEFVAMFCEANRCGRDRVVTRIEFEYVESKSGELLCQE